MRKIKAVCIVVLLLLSVTAIIVGCTSILSLSRCPKQSLSRGEAEKIATQKLKEYCEREGMNTSQFGKPEVSSVKEVPWIFDFTSTTAPRHFVRVHIDECGVVEVSADVYNP
jgi:hypothetical protein